MIFSTRSPGWTRAGVMDRRAIYLATKTGLFVCARTDGKLERLVRAPADIHALAADAEALYWFANDALYRMPKGGGAPQAVATGHLAHADDIAVDDRTVSWASWGEVRSSSGMALWTAPKRPSHDDPPRRRLELGQIDPGEVRTIAIDDGTVYLGLKGPGSAVLIVDPGAARPTPLGPRSGWGIVDGFAFDVSHVYWLDNERRRVFSRPKHGGSAAELAEIDDFADSITADASHVYWGDWGQNGDGGSVQRVPKRGGGKETLVSVEEQVAWVGVDAGLLYWFGPDVIQARVLS